MSKDEKNNAPELRLYLDVVLHAASYLSDESFGKVLKRAAFYAESGCMVKDENGLNDLEQYVLKEICQCIERTENARMEISKKNQRNRYSSEAAEWFGVLKQDLSAEDIDYFIECFKASGITSPRAFRLKYPNPNSIDGC